ncbi:MAG TPA: LamG-like jellyroll fold domain-containing protein [Puia sp.]|uniref:LamG-like jellyroll fold domain-containing protein n=1 Tax=Puia sp. TaxID=2045100 RepID=UPI002C68A7B1|nr:LamG-like jellyroll fold domain-containing protein [Puia sp.]HVU95099.1 LamG-like jellyroll fold domain-containing protein [Puia sp.]
MRKIYPFLLASLCISLNALSQNSSLNFTGSNYVTAGVDVINPIGDFTLEFWAYVPNTAVDGAVHQMASEGAAGFEFSIGYLGDGTIQVGDPGWFPSTGIQIPKDRWTHIALTYSTGGGGNAQLYLDGHNVATVDGFFFNDEQPFRIGVQVDITQPFIGRIDEVKAWKTSRTQPQVRSDMFGTPNFSDNNLIAYYEMNDGSSTAVTNSAATTGSSQDGVISGDTGGANSWAGSPIQYGNNALVFDGVDDQVDIPALTGNQYDLTSGGTVEFYVNPTTLPSSGWATIVGNRGAGGVRYSFHLSATQIGLDNGGASPNVLDYAVPTGPNNWTHLAFVYDGGSTTTVYVNGAFQGTINGSLGAASGQPLTFGMAKNTSGGDDKPFSGGIDEVRIWSTQRNAAQISANWKSTLTGTETGLIAQYTFDQGASDADDGGLTTAFDNTANANDGALMNFALNGTSSNFTTHALLSVPLPVTIAGFSATRSGNETVLQWQTATEQNSREFVIERSSDGKNYTAIGSVEAAGNSQTLQNYAYTDPQPMPNNNFYRLKQVDQDGKFDYSLVRSVNFPTTARLIWYITGRSSAGVWLQQGSDEPYALYDAAGRLLRAGNLSNGRTQLSQLPPGIYFVRVTTTTLTISLP